MIKLYRTLLTGAVLLAASPVFAAPQFTITNVVSVNPEAGPLYADPENNISGLVFGVTIKNTGDQDYIAGETVSDDPDKSYTLTLYQTSKQADLITVDIPESVAAGEEKTMNVAWPSFSINPLTQADPNSLTIWSCLAVRENYTDSYKTCLPWRDITPYRVAFNLVPLTSGIEVSSLINFGFVNEAATEQYRIRATGSGDIKVTSIEVPEGFTVSPAAPFTVYGALSENYTDGYQIIDITFNPTTSGVRAGDLKITAEGCDPKSYAISGAMVGPDDFFESFELPDGESLSTYVPTGWILSPNWAVKYNYNGATGNKYQLWHDSSMSSNYDFAITPKLAFGPDESMIFSAAKRSSDSKLEVMYSPDRITWTRLALLTPDLVAGEELNSKFAGSNDVMSTYAITPPEGEWYIGFKGLYVKIDDVFGGKTATVAHDILYTDGIATAKAVANHTVSFSATFKNINTSAEAADGYTVDFLIDDQVYRTLESSEWEAGATKTFDAGYMPNFEGEFTAQFRINAGDMTFVSPLWSVTVSPETASMELQIGTATAVSSCTPLRTNWNNSMSQNLYTADYLSRFGLEAGMKIASLKWNASCTSKKDITGTLKFWLTPTEDTQLNKDTPLDMTDIEPLYTEEYTWNINGSYSTPDEFQIGGQLTEPYEYTGGNLLFVAESTHQTAYSTINFQTDKSSSSNCIYRYNDNYDTYTGATYTSSTSEGLPVLVLDIATTPCSVSGSVTSKDEAIPDAVVTLTSGSVLYRTTTDAAGQYDMDIFQSELTYDMTVEAEGFAPYTQQGVTFDENQIIDVVLESVGSGVAGISTSAIRLENSVVTDMLYILGVDKAQLAVYSTTGAKVASAAGNSVRVSSLQPGLYILTVATEGIEKNFRFIKK